MKERDGIDEPGARPANSSTLMPVSGGAPGIVKSILTIQPIYDIQSSKSSIYRSMDNRAISKKSS